MKGLDLGASHVGRWGAVLPNCSLLAASDCRILRGLQPQPEETAMQEIWTKPQVTEQEVGLEVTSYIAAEIKDV